jgi:preprotein translocase subunit SecG
MGVFITILHVIVCIVLIVAVLLQSGKSADLAGAFGGGGSQSVFGPRGAASLLSKVTTICAVLFMITGLSLWLLSSGGARSVVSGVEAPPTETQPAATEVKKEGTEAQVPETKTPPPPEKKTGTEKEIK